MAASEYQQHDISHSRFRDNAIINQGNIYVHPPPPSPPPLPPARVGVVRVIPYHYNEDLVCRPDIVRKLDELLPQTTEFHSAALWGLGGSGKTQIALDYAYRRCRDSECSVFWVHADSEATFTFDYKTIGKQLGVDERLDGSDLLDAVRKSIEAQSKWVTIFDNADDLGLFGVGHSEGTRENLFKYIPRGSQGTILWTSRDAHITGTLVGPRRGIQVSSMTVDEAVALLEIAMGGKSAVGEMGMDRLLQELQWLPLAISQAGAYIRRALMTIQQYLDLLLQGASRWDLLRKSDSDRHRRPEVSNSVLQTWKISIERIEEESKLSYRILHVLAYLDSREIPHDLIMAACHYDCGDKGKDKQFTELEIREAVMRLVEFSFLSPRQADEGLPSYEMHKLVQEAVRYGLWIQGPDEATLSKTTAIMTTEGRLNSKEAYYAAIALQIVDDAFSSLKRNSWPQCDQYVAHAIQVAEWAESSGKEVESAALLWRVSSYLNNQGRWPEMEAVSRRVLELRQMVLGGKHPDTISSMRLLAYAYQLLGRYNECEGLIEPALYLHQEVLGERHPDTITTMVHFGRLRTAQGRYKEAEDVLTKALSLQPGASMGQDAFKTMRQIQGQSKKTEEIFIEAPGTQQEELEMTLSDSLTAMSTLAVVYRNQGRFKEAEEVINMVLNIQRGIHEENDSEILRALEFLAYVYSLQGRYEEAEEISIKVLNIQQKTLRENHPHIIAVMGQLSTIYRKLGHIEKAIEMSTKVLNLQREIFGEKHPDTLSAMIDFAALLRQNGDDKAEEMFAKALHLHKELLGEKHPRTIQALAEFALYYFDCQRDKAEKMFTEVLSLQQEVLGEKHLNTITTIWNLGATYWRMRDSRAEEYLKKASDLYREVLGEDHPETVSSMRNLAIIQDEQKQRRTAEEEQEQHRVMEEEEEEEEEERLIVEEGEKEGKKEEQHQPVKKVGHGKISFQLFKGWISKKRK